MPNNCSLATSLREVLIRAEYFHQISLMHDIRTISEAIRILSRTTELNKLYSKLIKGSLDPLSKGRSPAKDALAELRFVTFIHETLGCPVWLAEPDVQFDLNGTEVPVAVKRVMAATNNESQIRSARKQLDRTQSVGVIALDLDMQIGGYDTSGRVFQNSEMAGAACRDNNINYYNAIRNIRRKEVDGRLSVGAFFILSSLVGELADDDGPPMVIQRGGVFPTFGQSAKGKELSEKLNGKLSST